MGQEALLRLFNQFGAIIDDSHVVYTSGRHGRAYVNKDALFPWPNLVETICKELASRLHDTQVDVVVGPVAGGVAYAFELARHLGPEVLRIYAEKADGGGFVLKRGFDKLVEGKRVLVVEDILNTGGSVAAVIRAVQDAGGTIVAIAAICNRGGVTADQLQVPQLVSLVNVTMESWEAKDCPLCRDNVPINTKVGHGAEFVAAQNQVVN